MAEQEAVAYKKKQEELRQQYEKEQDLYENKALLSRDSKDKLSVNFMYEPPPGIKRDIPETTVDGGAAAEPQYKFEWQRKYNAPRESYCKGDTEIRDQPFGIQVRNVRCLKCGKYGHINTDKECQMFSISMSEARDILQTQAAAEEAKKSSSVLDKRQLLERQMASEDNLVMRQTAFSHRAGGSGSSSYGSRSHELVLDTPTARAGSSKSSRGNITEVEFLSSLSKEQKKELLRKLKRAEKKRKQRK